MTQWIGLGLSEDDFWRKTPRQIQLHFDGRALALKREHNERAWLAYHVAVLSRIKQIPPLHTLQDRTGVKRRVQTPEEMLAIARMFVSAPRVQTPKP